MCLASQSRAFVLVSRYPLLPVFLLGMVQGRFEQGKGRWTYENEPYMGTDLFPPLFFENNLSQHQGPKLSPMISHPQVSSNNTALFYSIPSVVSLDKSDEILYMGDPYETHLCCSYILCVFYAHKTIHILILLTQPDRSCQTRNERMEKSHVHSAL